ncbi:Protein of unknown function [Jiangella alkaliphila]|uniref:DUF4241 domain-containing protein n=2 Tax=Jiangella alkaliphila TaxID=419479 RepID=A0A1H2L1Z7_9ACTN|nr:Protein of unknown function [Jiangella alkaliphila]
MSSSPAHGPALERITTVEVDGDEATVRSIIDVGILPTYYEYRLVRRGSEWRIGQILSFLDPPGSLLVDDAEAARLLAGSTEEAPLSDIDPGLELDLPALFSAGRQVVFFEEPATIEVTELGEITCHLGALTVRDFGYGDSDLEPLGRRVPAGSYPVEVATVGRTNVAVRVRLSELPPVSWHPATRTNGSHVVGVDYGNVAILDLASLVRCDAQHVEELFEAQAQRLSNAPGTVFSLNGETNDAAMVTSGYGDGGYPCYWGVAADGTLAALVVDFLVLVEAKVSTITVPWRSGPASAPELSGCDLAITDDGGSFTVEYRGRNIDKIRVLAPNGVVLVDGYRLGLSVTGDWHRQTWRPAAPPPSGSVLEVTMDNGYRHT